MFGLLTISLFSLILGISGSPFSRPFQSDKVVWLGDSLTSQWISGTGLPIWQEHYANISVNTAVSGHTTTQVLGRILNDKVLQGLNSDVAVLMCGGNDIKNGRPPTEAIFNLLRIIGFVQQELPGIKILLLGLMPADVPDIIKDFGRHVNREISQYENGVDIFYLDMIYEFSDGDLIYPELYLDDGIHLTRAGYEMWQRTMEPLFQKLINL